MENTYVISVHAVYDSLGWLDRVQRRENSMQRRAKEAIFLAVEDKGENHMCAPIEIHKAQN